MGVGVKVALGAEVGGALLQRGKPTVYGGVLAAQQEAFVISQACRHPLHVGHEHQIGAAELPQQEGARLQLKGLLEGSGHLAEGGLG